MDYRDFRWIIEIYQGNPGNFQMFVRTNWSSTILTVCMCLTRVSSACSVYFITRELNFLRVSSSVEISILSRMDLDNIEILRFQSRFLDSKSRYSKGLISLSLDLFYVY